jgi:hypothetical protein
MWGLNLQQGVLVSEARGSSALSLSPQLVSIKASVCLRVLVSKIYLICTIVKMCNNGEGVQVSGGKLVCRGSGGRRSVETLTW